LGKIDKEIKKKHDQIYYTACKVIAEKGTGSGILIFSKKNEKNEGITYLLTNYHVVENNVKVVKKWDSSIKRKIDKEILKAVSVEFFSYNDFSKAVGSKTFEADIVAYSHSDELDLALLQLREKERTFENVALLYPYEVKEKIFTFDKVYAVGAGLGDPVFQTGGEITNASYEIGGRKYIGTNSPITFGNSGGGLFKLEEDGNYYFIGVPARVKLQGWSDVANHIGFAVPIATIYDFLEENCYEHIWDSTHTIENDEKRREKKRRRAKMMVFQEEPEEKVKTEIREPPYHY